MTAFPRLMGIMNVTPDSFSGDGLMSAPDVIACALAQARMMVEGGAELLDVGGESTRPGSQPVPCDQEVARVVPVIKALRTEFPHIQISIDTMKPAVARAAIDVGATLINDVSGAAMDDDMLALAAENAVPLVLMHNRANAQAVTQSAIGGEYQGADYSDVVADVCGDLLALVDRALAAGVLRSQIILDAGLGFGKSVQENLKLVNATDQIKALGFPVLVAPSRKSFIGRALDVPPDDRLEGTAAAIAVATLRGADILRVHDVPFMARVARMTRLIADA